MSELYKEKLWNATPKKRLEKWKQCDTGDIVEKQTFLSEKRKGHSINDVEMDQVLIF